MSSHYSKYVKDTVAHELYISYILFNLLKATVVQYWVHQQWKTIPYKVMSISFLTLISLTNLSTAHPRENLQCHWVFVLNIFKLKFHSLWHVKYSTDKKQGTYTVLQENPQRTHFPKYIKYCKPQHTPKAQQDVTEKHSLNPHYNHPCYSYGENPNKIFGPIVPYMENSTHMSTSKDTNYLKQFPILLQYYM